MRSREGLTLTWPAARLLKRFGRSDVRIPTSTISFVDGHLAKYWSTEFAVQTAEWCIEVHDGLGVLEEYRAERWLRGDGLGNRGRYNPSAVPGCARDHGP